ncbi:hypothetical protein T484DRAFT_1864492 [Baffinella frigidus]|nr:hypothetical protein T484DRAFT_1864492 [Cryptophyta sp. CCMP2293]
MGKEDSAGAKGVAVRAPSGRERRAPVPSDENWGASQHKRSRPDKPEPAAQGRAKKSKPKDGEQGAAPQPGAKVGFAFAPPERALGKSAAPLHGAESAPPKVLKAAASGSAGSVARQSMGGGALPSRWEEGLELKVVGHRDDAFWDGKFEYNLSFLKKAPCCGAKSGDAWVSRVELLAFGAPGEGKALLLAYRLPVLVLPFKDRLSKAGRAGEKEHPFLSSKEMARNISFVVASEQEYLGGPAGSREGLLEMLSGVAADSSKARQKKVHEALAQGIVRAAASCGAPGRIARWWRRAREDTCQRKIFSSMDKSPLLVRRRSRVLSPDAARAQTAPDGPVSWQVALSPPPLGQKGGAVARPDALDVLLRLVSDDEYDNLMGSFWRLHELEGDAAEAELFEEAVIDVKGSDEKALTEKWVVFCCLVSPLLSLPASAAAAAARLSATDVTIPIGALTFSNVDRDGVDEDD